MISEDKEVLLKTKRLGLPYYNAHMMLIFLFFKNVITSQEYAALLSRLTRVAWYSDDILQKGQEIFTLLTQTGDVG